MIDEQENEKLSARTLEIETKLARLSDSVDWLLRAGLNRSDPLSVLAAQAPSLASLIEEERASPTLRHIRI